MTNLRSHVLIRREPAARQPDDLPADALYKAERAKMLVNDPILADAFAEIEIAHIEAALRAKTDAERKDALDQANAIRAVREKLEGIVATAEHAAKERMQVP